jgi:hypothetical protein
MQRIHILILLLATSLITSQACYAGPNSGGRGHRGHHGQHRRHRSRRGRNRGWANYSVIAAPIVYSGGGYYAGNTRYNAAYPMRSPMIVSPVNPLGGYFGFSVGVGFLNSTGLGLNLDNSNNSGLGVGVEFGANLTQNLALEAGFMHMPSATSNKSNASITNSRFTDIAVRLSLPVQKALAVYTKLGAAYASATLNKNNNKAFNNNATLPYYAMGLIAQAGEGLAFEFQYQATPTAGNKLTNGVPGMGMLSAGIIANF